MSGAVSCSRICDQSLIVLDNHDLCASRSHRDSSPSFATVLEGAPQTFTKDAAYLLLFNLDIS